MQQLTFKRSIHLNICSSDQWQASHRLKNTKARNNLAMFSVLWRQSLQFAGSKTFCNRSRHQSYVRVLTDIRVLENMQVQMLKAILRSRASMVVRYKIKIELIFIYFLNTYKSFILNFILHLLSSIRLYKRRTLLSSPPLSDYVAGRRRNKE